MRTGIGTSDLADSRRAGSTAARDALAQLGDDRPELVFAYASVRYDLPAVLAAINEETGGAPLVGASASGQIHDGRLTGDGPSVSVLVLSGANYRFGIGYADNAGADPARAGHDLARLSPAAAWKICRERGRKAQIQATAPHDLRRTWMGDLLDLGHRPGHGAEDGGSRVSLDHRRLRPSGSRSSAPGRHPA